MRPWDSEQGLFDRMGALGFPYYENMTVKDYIRSFQNRYQIENTETAKKANEMLNLFMAEKWCQKD